MAAVTICSNFRAHKEEICHCFQLLPLYLPWCDGTRCHDFSFLILSFKPAFSLSSFPLVKRLFSSSLLSAIRVVSISSKGFLSTVVYIMIIWIKFTFSSLIPKMLMFTLAISCLTKSNLPWFMDLTFQVPMQKCSLQHWILLSSPDISTTECCFHFILSGAISNFPPLFFCGILNTFWPGSGGGLIFQCDIFLPFYTAHGVLMGRILDSHSLLYWTTFYQNSPLWPIHLGWPYQAWPELHWVMQVPSPWQGSNPWRGQVIKWFSYFSIHKNHLKGLLK